MRTIALAIALLPLTLHAAPRESLADFFQKRAAQPIELIDTERSNEIPAKIQQVGSDFVCFTTDIEGDGSRLITKCYPYVQIRVIFELNGKLVVTPERY